MKQNYISPELKFIRVQSQDIMTLSDDSFVDAGDEGLFGD